MQLLHIVILLQFTGRSSRLESANWSCPPTCFRLFHLWNVLLKGASNSQHLDSPRSPLSDSEFSEFSDQGGAVLQAGAGRHQSGRKGQRGQRGQRDGKEPMFSRGNLQSKLAVLRQVCWPTQLWFCTAVVSAPWPASTVVARLEGLERASLLDLLELNIVGTLSAFTDRGIATATISTTEVRLNAELVQSAFSSNKECSLRFWGVGVPTLGELFSSI